MAENKDTVEETIKEQPKVDNTVGKLRARKKTYSSNTDEVTKVKIDTPLVKSEDTKENPVEEKVVVVNEDPVVENETKEEVKEEVKEDLPIIEDVTDQEIEKVEDIVEDAVAEAEQTGKPLPENIQKLVDFMDETGGSLNDYVKLNRDISNMDDSDVLDEYYRETKSHLTPEERSFIMENKYGIDEEIDDDIAKRKKQIALKEQVAEARAHLDRQKSKHYEEIKAGSRLTPEAKKAMDFFSRHNKESEEQKKVSDASKRTFLNKTNSVFNKNFKGFDYEVGDRKFRFNVKDVKSTKETQSDLNNFVNKFVGEDKSTIQDAAGYHKSLFTAMNADAVASHFYEQGKADAIRSQVAKDKNINLDPRKTHGETNVGGVKYKVLGSSTDDFKLRIKKRK